MIVPLNIVAIFLFALFSVTASLVIVVLLVRSFKEKQKVFSVFSEYVGEFMLVFSVDGNLLDVSPRFSSDPLFEKICQEGNFKSVLSSRDYSSMRDYMKRLASYPEMSFLFSFESERGLCWYELRAHIQKDVGNDKVVFFIKNVTHDLESRNQRDMLELKNDMLLQNTGDFLWKIDVESRQWSLLTPLVDDDGVVLPSSAVEQDVRSMMPEKDYATFEKFLNSRIVDFRASGHDAEVNRGLTLRLSGRDGELHWYMFRGRLVVEEGSKMVFRGIARRIEFLQSNPVLEGEVNGSMLLSSALAIPDIRIFWVDRDYRIVGCNQTFCMIFDKASPSAVTGKRLLEVVGQRYFSFFHRYLLNVFERGRPVAWKGPFGTADKLLWINGVPLKNLDGTTEKVMMAYMLLDVKDFNEK